MKSRFEFIELSFLLIQVLDKPASPFLHFDKTSLEAYPEWSLVSLAMFYLVISDWILGMPHVVGDELFNLRLPGRLQIVVSYILDLVHESFNVFN